MSASIEERVRTAIVRALGSGAVSSGLPLAMGVTPGWDSMGHMSVVLELEREFGIRFQTYRLPQLIDVEVIVPAVRELAGA